MNGEDHRVLLGVPASGAKNIVKRVRGEYGTGYSVRNAKKSQVCNFHSSLQVEEKNVQDQAEVQNWK